tara:strand:- start:55 stop:786 length:732 start_codon:yes stop_codon:yes gene_type:complete
VKTIGIIGYGEIGQALDKLYVSRGLIPLIRDLDRDDGLGGVHVLNITIPWSHDFISTVGDYIKEISPRLVIIHSTVPPGTTRELSKDFSNIVHSPVRGIHPHLFEGLKTFVKVVGGGGQLDAQEHLKSLGLKVEVYQNSAATEVAKLMDTSYYGVCIAWHDYAQKLCDLWGVEFEEVQTHYNSTYNSGYTQLGNPNVVRPILTAPDGPIGGHCVVSNAEILREALDSKLLESITDLGNTPPKE